MCGLLNPDRKVLMQRLWKCPSSRAVTPVCAKVVGCACTPLVGLLILSFWLLVAVHPLQASEPLQYHLSTTLSAGTGAFAPFWLHQGRQGTRLYKPNAVHLDAGLLSDYHDSEKALEIGYGLNTVFRAASDTADVLISELYFKTRLYFLELLVGSRPVRTGIEYEPLSSGGMLLSNNALALPGITAGFNRFVSVPFTFDMFQLKGALSHSYFTDDVGYKNVMLHHKWVHFQLGKPLPVRLQYRFDHVAQWGGKSLIPCKPDQPSSFNAFKSILLVRSGGEGASEHDQINVLGNHIIGQSLKMEIEARRWLTTLYWQQILEDKPFRFMGYTMNSPDGLWGISFHTKKQSWLSSVLYEYVNTTDQSGPYHDRDGVVYGGADNYFVSNYPGGWTHHSNIIGTPFIQSPVYQPGLSIDSLRNCVKAHHFGLEGSYGALSYRMKASFVKSYAGNANDFIPLILMPVNHQRYYLVALHYEPAHWNDYSLGVELGIDRGTATGNATGVQLSLRKTGVFH